MTQVSHRRLLQGRPSVLESFQAERTVLEQRPATPRFDRREYTYTWPPGAYRHMPIQTAVDRTERLSRETIDIEIRDNGTLLETLRFPVFGRYGHDPNDPAWFSDRVDPRVAICSVLAPYAAARCLAWGVAW